MWSLCHACHHVLLVKQPRIGGRCTNMVFGVIKALVLVYLWLLSLLLVFFFLLYFYNCLLLCKQYLFTISNDIFFSWLKASMTILRWIYGVCCATTAFIPSFHNHKIQSFKGLLMTSYSTRYLKITTLFHGQVGQACGHPTKIQQPLPIVHGSSYFEILNTNNCSLLTFCFVPLQLKISTNIKTKISGIFESYRHNMHFFFSSPCYYMEIFITLT